MNKVTQYNIFLGRTASLTILSGTALLIMASGRLAHAITVFGAMMWVNILSALTAHTGARVFPRRGRVVLLAFLTSFFAGIFLLVLWMLSPLCALESFFAVSVIPMFCMVSGIYKQLETLTLKDTLLTSFSETVIFGLLIIILALIREPLGYLSLSLPGGTRGIVLLFSLTTESFLPIHLIAASCGALLLIGYFMGLFRYIKEKYPLVTGGKNDA